jgi:ubiquinone/menaquinone biosynthesis C-methylase UbiE
VLEIGCGTGSSTVALASQAQKVISVDIHTPSLDVAKMRIEEDGFADAVTFFQVDPVLEGLHVSPESIDAVVCYAVLEHMLPSERQKCIQRVWKWLKPGGVLVIYECPNRLWPQDLHTTGLWGWSWLPPELALWYGHVFKRFDAGMTLEQMYREGYSLTF